MSEIRINADDQADEIRFHLNNARGAKLASQSLEDNDENRELLTTGMESAIVAAILAKQGIRALPGDERFAEMLPRARKLVRWYREALRFRWAAVHQNETAQPAATNGNGNGGKPVVPRRRVPLSDDMKKQIHDLALDCPPDRGRTEWYRQIADDLHVALSTVYRCMNEVR